MYLADIRNQCVIIYNLGVAAVMPGKCTLFTFVSWWPNSQNNSTCILFVSTEKGNMLKLKVTFTF